MKLLLILPLDVRFATPPDMTLSSFHGGNGRLLLLLCFHPLQHLFSSCIYLRASIYVLAVAATGSAMSNLFIYLLILCVFFLVLFLHVCGFFFFYPEKAI